MITRNNITCCNGCPKREIGCHSGCEDYIAQKKEMDESKAFIREAREKDGIGTVSDSCDRYRRSRK